MEIRVGSISAKQGEKVQGFLNVPKSHAKLPITIINGVNDGKKVVITAGVHGGEYNGIENSIRLAKSIDPKDVTGSIVIVHLVNAKGFYEKRQYVNPSDNINMNRVFPGNGEGIVSQKIAYALTNDVMQDADFFIDMHGGDLHEELLPFVVSPGYEDKKTLEITREAIKYTGIEYTLELFVKGTTIGAASGLNIPGFLMEIGGLGILDEELAEKYFYGVTNVLKHLSVLSGDAQLPDVEQKKIIEYIGANAEETGLWYPCVNLGDFAKKGTKIGEVKDIFGNLVKEYFAEYDSVVLLVVRSLAINTGEPIYSLGIIK